MLLSVRPVLPPRILRLRVVGPLTAIILCRLLSTTKTTTMPPAPWIPNRYPPTRRENHVDEYTSASRGLVRVPDPYRWLEEDTEETDKWTSAQEAFTRSYLDQNPDRQKLEDAFMANMNYAKFTAPSLEDDGRWYWLYNSGLLPQSVLYRSKGSLLPDFSTREDSAVGEVFFDPNLLTDDGTAALTMYDICESGEYFAYGISQSGSDVSTIYVRRTDAPFSSSTIKEPKIDSGRMSDEVRHVKFSNIVWSKDSKGFFYHRYPDRAEKEGIETRDDVDAMMCYHRVGTPQSEDVIIHKDPENPTWSWSIQITEDGKYIALYIVKDSSRRNKLWIADLSENKIGPGIKWRKLKDEFEAEYELIANDGPLLYLKTNRNAPQYKLVTVDLSEAEPSEKDLLPEDKNAYLGHISCVNKHSQFAVVYKRNVKDEIYLYSKKGAQLARLAPEFVGAAFVSGREKHADMFITLVGFETPGTVARYNFAEPVREQRWAVYRTTKLNGLNADDFESRQVWYESKDGTKVPMFIVRHKSTPFDGTAPAIQYGYGGFSISINPFFSSTLLTFLQAYGAILVVPNIRGGSEFGEEWHKAGIREEKHNTFDDFIAATEYLVKHKYAAPGKVAINGGSNGGLLIAACVNRAPEGLFGAAIAEVGVLDLLKFHKYTIGRAWMSDYGDPDDPHDFDFIYPISPLHNIPTDRILPPTLLLTADHDDRVVPMHSFKHAATLQHMLPNNPHPLLLRVDKKAGHGGGKSTIKRIKEAADKWGFVAQNLGLMWRSQAKS